MHIADSEVEGASGDSVSARYTPLIVIITISPFHIFTQLTVHV